MENSKQDYLTISSVSGELLDSKDRTYKRVECAPLSSMMFNPIVGRDMPIIDPSINPVSFNQHADPFDEGKADKLYNTPVGTILPGKIVKKAVPPYSFADKVTGEMKTVEVRTLAVFGDTSDVETFKTNIIAEFNRNKYFLKSDGTPDLERAQAAGISDINYAPVEQEESAEDYAEEAKAEVPAED